MSLALYPSRVRSSDLLGGARRSRFNGLAKAKSISVAIFDVEIATSVRLSAYIARNLDVSRREFCTPLIDIVDPYIRIPGFTTRDHPVWPHCARLFVLREHDDHFATRDHAKGRWLTPKAVISKAEFVSIEICRCDNVVYNEVRSNTPAGVKGFDVTSHARTTLYIAA
jgi:hypothetical protein